MSSKQITIGDIYMIKLGRNEVEAEVTEQLENGWNVRLTASDKIIKVASVDRFLRKVKTKPEQPTKKKGGAVKGLMSGLEAAAFILKQTGRPMRVKEIAEIAIREQLWGSEGATPWASIASSIIRDIAAKGEDSRFEKIDKGLFVAR